MLRAAVRLLWGLEVRHLAAHRIRLALSVLGVASGVALTIAVDGFNDSITATLADVSRTASTRATLEVRPIAGGTLPPSVADDVARVPGVGSVSSTIEAFTTLRRAGREVRTLVLGVEALPARQSDGRRLGVEGLRTADIEDPTGAGRIFSEGVDAIFDDLPAASGARIVVSPAVSRALRARVGDDVEAQTPLGWRTASVAGIVAAGGVRSALTVAGEVSEIGTLLGRSDGVDVVYVTARRGLQGDVQRAVGARARVGAVGMRDRQMKQLLSGATLLFGLAGVNALFVGGFLVYNTVTMLAAERVVEIATLRAVGARRRQVVALQCADGVLIGIAGAAVGVVAGLGMARALIGFGGASLRSVYPLELTAQVVRPAELARSAILGVGAALAASLIPARRVARADPVRALGPAGALEEPEHRSRRGVAVAGAILLAAGTAGIIWLVAVGRLDQIGGALGLSLAGVALLIRPGVPALCAAMLRVATRDRSRAPGIVRLAAGEATRSPGRTAFTAGALLVALAVMISVALGARSFARTYDVALSGTFRADLYVRAGTWHLFGADVPVDAALADELRSVPGVVVAYPYRTIMTSLRDTAIVIIADDHDAYSRLPGVTGDARRDAQSRASLQARQGTVLVSSSAVQQLDLRPGTSFEMPTPAGTARLRVAGTVPDPAAYAPRVYMDFEQYASLYGSRAADTFPVGISRGTDPALVKERIADRLGARFGVEVDSRADYLRRENSVVGAVFSLLTWLLLTVVLVAALGIANTLLMSTLERRRELGVMRAVGMRRRDLRRMVVIEAFMVSSIGIGLALVLGTALGYLFMLTSQVNIGVPIPLVLAPAPYLQAAALGLIVAGLAAAYPARRAGAVDIVDALRYE